MIASAVWLRSIKDCQRCLRLPCFRRARAAFWDSVRWLTGVTLAGMAGPVRVREISDDEGNRLKRIVRRGSGSVVTWRRAQMVLSQAQGMSVPQIARLGFTSKEDRVRDVLHNFSADGFDSLYPRGCTGGHPPVFTLAQRREIKKIAKSDPADHGLPFSRWSDPGGLFATRPARCSIRVVLIVMIACCGRSFPLVPAAEWVCHVDAACPLAGAGSADHGGDQGDVRFPED